MRPASVLSTSSRVALVLALAASPAAAQEGDLPLSMEYKDVLTAGKEQPCLTLQATGNLKNLKVTLSREGMRKAFSAARMGEGQSRKFCWKEKPGVYQYALRIACSFEGQPHTRDVELDLSYLPPMQMLLTKDRIDLDHHKLVFFLNHPADHAELTIYGKEGKVLQAASESYGDAQPGKALELGWKEVKDEIVRMELKAYNKHGGWVGMAITPWMITIPHEEVVFETDKSEIRASESPKLDAAITQIHKALKEHASELKVKLYVAGFTDTVGSQGHNRTLSTDRARAIALYFKKRGVTIPILFRGYGEEALAVATPDNTDEPRNRRALYVLGAQAPEIGNNVSWGGWKGAN